MESRLIYAKEECGDDDNAAMFFLHLEPIDADDLPLRRKLYGFDNLDFSFSWHHNAFGEMCIAIVPLPEYDIAAIRTGQYARVDGGFQRIWEEEIHLGE